MKLNGRLELTWTGKENRRLIEKRILIEDKSKSYGNPDSENMLIHGDNLLALKALEKKYTGKIKCIYIDPPYNTGSAFEHYDDNLEHSTWLSLMRERLLILNNLLSDDGVIWIQIDDEEQAYLKVLCDEIFGRNNFLNMITIKMKNIAGASGGGEDRRLKKNVEYILVYTKKYDCFKWLRNAYSYTEIYQLINNYKANDISWKYTSVIYDKGEEQYICSTVDGDGNEIKIFNRKNARIMSIGQISKLEGISEKEVYYKYMDSIFTTAMPQSSIRPRVMERLSGIEHEDIISIKYVPKTGKNKGIEYEQFYKGEKFRLFTWLRDVAEFREGKWCKKDLQGTFWDGFNLNNLTKEGGVEFPNGKKPEALISRIIDMCTNEGEIVLDSFLGSGTTCAVAHKMNRKWIGIEMGEQAYTHCKFRIDKIIKGNDDGGITGSVNWTGGGGYKFFELSEPIFVKHPVLGFYQINPSFDLSMFRYAICSIEGYDYKENGMIHGCSSEKHYIHITRDFVNGEYVKELINSISDDESLTIYCMKYQSDIRLPENIEIIDIMKKVLPKCVDLKEED